MIDRRKVLKACLGASVLPAVACSGDRSASPPASAPAGASAQPATPPAGTPPPGTIVEALDIHFKGMAFFLVPTNPAVKMVHIALPRVTMPHYGTLRIPRIAVADTSTAEPVGADEANVYFSLVGGDAKKVLKIVPRPSSDPGTWKGVADADLEIGRNNPDPAGCGTSNWDSVKWLIDFKADLYPDAKLDPDWQKSRALAGRIELTHGLLEKGLGDDGFDHFTYQLKDTNGNTKTRLIKDIARYRLTSRFVEFQLGDKSCIVDTSKRYREPGAVPLRVAIDHVPATWMDNTGEMNDYKALYDLMLNPPPMDERPVPFGRKPCSTAGGATGGCECCPIPEMPV
jgi:hypothetical protein